ncbi:unnamed protein product [marine sediment metagenome]|uniref:Uncharacterized protein n=1 Tax=marine sediment metagenome TaxID=412755 RepID=X1RU73_9ZZZZ
MAQEFALVTPGTEEMTKMAAGGAGAGIIGVVEGMAVKMAPQLGALEPVVTWGTLLGVPVVAAVGALFAPRGMISDLCMGAACGGLGVLGYSLPELLAPFGLGRRGGSPSAEERARLAAAREKVKQLPPGPLFAPQRAQANVRAYVGAGYE